MTQIRLHRYAQVAGQVERLAKQLAVVEDVSYTCETAAHFWLLHVLARWEKFVTEVERRRTPECVQVCRSPNEARVQKVGAHPTLLYLRYVEMKTYVASEFRCAH